MSGYTPIRQEYNVFKSENGDNESLAPIILIHGIFSCKESWRDFPQVIANETKRKVYAVDIRSHGDSEWTEEFDFEVMTKDILHLMEQINCSKAIILGHSVGGRTAIKLALEHAEKVEKLIIEEMFRRKLSSKVINTLMTFVTKAPDALGKIPKGTEETVAAGIVVNHIYGIHPQGKDEQNAPTKACPHSVGLKKTETGEYEFKTNMNSIIKALKNASDILVEPEGRFDGPACFIYGKDSPYRINEEADDIKKYFPNAEFVGIEGAKHNVHTEKNKEFLDAVLKFLLK